MDPVSYITSYARRRSNVYEKMDKFSRGARRARYRWPPRQMALQAGYGRMRAPYSLKPGIHTSCDGGHRLFLFPNWKITHSATILFFCNPLDFQSFCSARRRTATASPRARPRTRQPRRKPTTATRRHLATQRRPERSPAMPEPPAAPLDLAAVAQDVQQESGRYPT